MTVLSRYGRLPLRQRNIVVALLNGRDVRAWQHHHTAVLSLIAKGIVLASATTCRLTLLPPAGGIQKAAA